jgi:ankyrin repeat protein
MLPSMPSSAEIQEAYGHCPKPWETARMFHAAWHGDLRPMLRAIQDGASVDALEPGRATLAQICALRGPIELLRAAFEAGASARKPPDSERPSVLSSLASRSGPQLNSADEPRQENMQALAMAKMACDFGARVDAETSSHWFDHPLPQAASRDALEMARLLLARGAQADRKFSFGMTPLLIACEAGAERVAHLLLDWSELNLLPSSPVDATAQHQGHAQGAIHFSAASGCSGALVERLAGLGVAFDSQDARAMTPLQMAAQSGRLEAIRVLAKLGAELNAPHAPSKNISPLFRAIDNDQAQACALLLALGADPDALDHHGRSARQAARQSTRPDLLAAFGAFDAAREGADISQALTDAAPAPRRILSL